MIATVFCDWWFYTFRGVKESSSLPIGFFEERQITSHQVDKYIKFVINIKRINFSWAMIFAVIGFLCHTPSFIWLSMGVFYIGSIVMVGLALALSYVRQPYPITWVSANPFDHTNPMGYFNPISPHYINRR